MISTSRFVFEGLQNITDQALKFNQ